jgi:hypothetical protein
MHIASTPKIDNLKTDNLKIDILRSRFIGQLLSVLGFVAPVDWALAVRPGADGQCASVQGLNGPQAVLQDWLRVFAAASVFAGLLD